MTLRSALVLALLSSSLSVPSGAHAQECPNASAMTKGLALPLSAVRFLADDALGGRLAGSPGERCAGDYIAAEFGRLKLRPAGENGTFFQGLSLASVLNPHAAGGTGRNVLAALDGRDPTLRHEWVVIGAHYDHLGEGGTPNSLAPGEKAIHNGADDNASGTSAVIRAAEILSRGPRPARSILFIAFTGEESGLLGSAHFMANPTFGADKIVAMINLDMVGRLGGGQLIVYGVDTAAEWRSLVEPAAEKAGVRMATRGEGFGASDHTSFYLKDIPVLHFFTNTHADYHKPGDDWNKIDGPGLEKIATMVGDVALNVANRNQALTLQKGAGEPPRMALSGGSGAYFGSIPDFSPVERGVKLSGVTAGSPADKAGVKTGDVVIAMGENAIADLQGMTDVLNKFKPGDSTTVQVLRGTERLTLSVTLGSRASR